jgi:hypothetical protein
MDHRVKPGGNEKKSDYETEEDSGNGKQVFARVSGLLRRCAPRNDEVQR